MSQHIDPPATQTGLEGLASTVSTLSNKITSAFTLHQSTLGSYKHTTANAWEYTGLSIEVPANHVYVGSLYGGYNSGKPIGVGVDNNNALIGDIPSQSAESSNGQYSVTLILYPGTWKVYTKRVAVATTTNNYYFRYIDIY